MVHINLDTFFSVCSNIPVWFCLVVKTKNQHCSISRNLWASICFVDVVLETDHMTGNGSRKWKIVMDLVLVLVLVLVVISAPLLGLCWFSPPFCHWFRLLMWTFVALWRHAGSSSADLSPLRTISFCWVSCQERPSHWTSWRTGTFPVLWEGVGGGGVGVGGGGLEKALQLF